MTPQYSWSLAICSLLMLPRAACPTLVVSGSRGETDTRKNAAILTSTSRTAIRMKLTPACFQLMILSFLPTYNSV